MVGINDFGIDQFFYVSSGIGVDDRSLFIAGLVAEVAHGSDD